MAHCDDAWRVEQLEALLNLSSALRPELPPEELHILSLESLCQAGSYEDAVLWVKEAAETFTLGSSRCFSVTFDPVKCLPLVTVQQILSRCARGGPVYWSPLIADVLGLCLQRPASHLPTDGHCLFVPLVYTEPVGLSLFIGSQPQPDPTACEFLGRFADQIAVILTTSRIFSEHEQMMFELRRALEAQEDLQRKVIELSAPVLPLLPDVLVLPLVGAIDAGRITRVLDELLHSITQHRARVVIIDITGVPVVDTSVAAQLISVANAARLLGCKTMLVGIRPEIAQTIVSLGLTMDQLSTLASLAEGLRAALGEVGLQLVPKARHFV